MCKLLQFAATSSHNTQSNSITRDTHSHTQSQSHTHTHTQSQSQSHNTQTPSSGRSSTAQSPTMVCLSAEELDRWRESLCALLTEKFQDHWHADSTCKGQGFRCITITDQAEGIPLDPVLLMAAQRAQIPIDALRFPLEFSLWIDPGEVTCRIGDTKNMTIPIGTRNKDSGRFESLLDSLDLSDLTCKAEEMRDSDPRHLLLRYSSQRMNLARYGTGTAAKGSSASSNSYSNNISFSSGSGSGSHSSNAISALSSSPYNHMSAPPYLMNGMNGFSQSVGPSQLMYGLYMGDESVYSAAPYMLGPNSTGPTSYRYGPGPGPGPAPGQPQHHWRPNHGSNGAITCSNGSTGKRSLLNQNSSATAAASGTVTGTGSLTNSATRDGYRFMNGFRFMPGAGRESPVASQSPMKYANSGAGPPSTVAQNLMSHFYALDPTA